jgi:hypothetical protein
MSHNADLDRIRRLRIGTRTRLLTINKHHEPSQVAGGNFAETMRKGCRRGLAGARAGGWCWLNRGTRP